MKFKASATVEHKDSTQVARAVPGAPLVVFKLQSVPVLGSLSLPGTNGFYEGEARAVSGLLP